MSETVTNVSDSEQLFRIIEGSRDAINALPDIRVGENEREEQLKAEIGAFASSLVLDNPMDILDEDIPEELARARDEYYGAKFANRLTNAMMDRIEERNFERLIELAGDRQLRITVPASKVNKHEHGYGGSSHLSDELITVEGTLYPHTLELWKGEICVDVGRIGECACKPHVSVKLIDRYYTEERIAEVEVLD